MTQPKRVHCVCPQKHVLLIAHVSPRLDDVQAVAVARQTIQEVLRHYRPYCRHCGAPPESWVIEVPPQSDDAQTGFDEIISAGAQAQSLENLQVWKRPARRKGWLN